MKKLCMFSLVMIVFSGYVVCMETPTTPTRPAAREVTGEIFRKVEKRSWAHDLTQQERFQLAVHDAKQARYSEISKKLISIAPWNKGIIWGITPETEGKILVTSFMPACLLNRFYLNQTAYNYITKEKREEFEAGNHKVVVKVQEADRTSMINDTNNPPGWFTSEGYRMLPNADFPFFTHLLRRNGNDIAVLAWVNVIPEVKEFVHEYMKKNKGISYENLLNRLDERLGLAPSWEGQRKVFVEQWVDPKDLFRPSVDPEIFDSDAFAADAENAELYKGMTRAAPAPVFSQPFVKNNQEEKYKSEDGKKWISQKAKGRYLDWFDKNKEISYTEWNVPWSRLGYSYDYGADAFGKTAAGQHYGCSEFCIKPHSKVILAGIYSIDRYAESLKGNVITIAGQFKQAFVELNKKVNTVRLSFAGVLGKKSNDEIIDRNLESLKETGVRADETMKRETHETIVAWLVSSENQNKKDHTIFFRDRHNNSGRYLEEQINAQSRFFYLKKSFEKMEKRFKGESFGNFQEIFDKVRRLISKGEEQFEKVRKNIVTFTQIGADAKAILDGVEKRAGEKKPKWRPALRKRRSLPIKK